MSRRTEFRYETIMSMALLVGSGVWKINQGGDHPSTKEEVLTLFQRAFLLTIAKEASGACGFNPNGGFSDIITFENDNGIDIVAGCTNNAFRAIVTGLWGSIDGEQLYLNVKGMGLEIEYFRYLSKPMEGYISVSDILNGAATNAPNVRRFITMLCSQPFIYTAHLFDEKGIGLLEYPEEMRNKTIRAASTLG